MRLIRKRNKKTKEDKRSVSLKASTFKVKVEEYDFKTKKKKKRNGFLRETLK